jgi:hypothetical protein
MVERQSSLPRQPARCARPGLVPGRRCADCSGARCCNDRLRCFLRAALCAACPLMHSAARKNKPPFCHVGKVAFGRSGVGDAGAGSKREKFRGCSGHSSAKAPISARFAACTSARASAILGSVAKPYGRGLECATRPLGTNRLAAPLILLARTPAVQMGKDLGDHRGIEDRGDDLQTPATALRSVRRRYRRRA